MASEQRTEPERVKQKLITGMFMSGDGADDSYGNMVRLRQVPPVIADRVTDPKRSAPRDADEEKW